MHQDDVAGRSGILDNLERYPVHLFDTFVKPLYPGTRIARGVQIPQVRVPCERFAELGSSGLPWRWIFRKPPMRKTM
jgi:hypothetical protein